MKTVVTREIWASAYLLASGARLIKTIPGYFVGFVFEDQDGRASQALGEWRDGDARISARTIAEAYRDMRRLSYLERVA